MHRLCAGALSGRDHRVDIEIALARGRGPDVDGDVCLGDVAGAGVGVAEHRDRPDTHRTQRADHPHRDLAAVGDQDCLDSRSCHHIRNTP